MGFCLKIVKLENLNICFDYVYGLGIECDSNFYFGIVESF